MHQVEDKPETIHLYVVREESARPSFAPIVLSLFTLSLLIVLGIATPYTQPVIRIALRVPAVPLGVKSFSASVAIVPTGVRTYPATFAHGLLTIQNGSIIGQSIPTGFAVGGVATDKAVYVPGATADGFGTATVAAHELTAGVNLPKLAINQVIGPSLFIRNLRPFTGGQPAYSVKYVTGQDKQSALQAARLFVQISVNKNGLHYPCLEAHLYEHMRLTINWRCQFLTFSVPSYMHVSSVRLVGTQIIVNVWFVEHPKRIWVK